MQRDVDEVVQRANALLPRVGQEGFKDVEELKRLACSMFVYLFESLFHTLEDIERRPRFKAEYAFNADQVIQALSVIVGADLSYISGSEIADGNIDHIAALLAEFEEYLALEDRENAELGYSYEEEDVGGQVRNVYDTKEDVEYGERLMEGGEDTYYDEHDAELKFAEETAEGFLKEASSYDYHEEDDYLTDDFDTRRASDFYEDEEEYENEGAYEEDDYFNSEDDYYRESTDGYHDLSEDMEGSDRDFGMYPTISSSGRREESLPSITKRRPTSFQTSSPRDRSRPSITRTGLGSGGQVTGASYASRPTRPRSRFIPSSPSSSSATSLGVSENYLDEMISRFPAEEMRRHKQFSALRKLARHRSDDSAKESEYSAKLNAQKQRDKGRFRKAYESILEQERTEERIRAQRRRLLDQLERKRKAHEEKVERIRMERLAEQLAREAEARRLRRKTREDALVKRMFDEALATEKERILHLNKLASEERARQDSEALRKYETARQIYEDQKDMLEAERREKERAEKQQRRLQQDEVRRLSKELKQDFDRKLQDARLALDAREERIFYVNSQVIEKAFAALSDTRNALYSAQATAFG